MRQLAARGLSGLFAVSWLVLPGFGLIDLSVTWNADWPQVLEAGWGLFATAIVAAAFVLIAVWPRAATAGTAQLVVATVCLAVSAVAAKETRLFVLVALLGLQTAMVGGLLAKALREGTDPSRHRSQFSQSLFLVAAAAVVPWLSYGLQMWALNRENRPDGDITLGIDHYSVQGALALALAVLPVAAALRANLRPFFPVCTSVAASYLGLVSLAWPDAAGGLGRTWSIAAIVWGVALLAAVFSADPRRATPADRLTG
jgi:hypothetical protein